MAKRIKLVWDFFGPESASFAEHHAKHLQEFATKHQLETPETGIEMVNENQHFAFLLVNPSNMIQVRDTLKPTRGFEVGT